MFTATVGISIIEQAPTLAQLRRILAEVHDPATDEDVAVWENGRRLVLVLTHDGRTLEMDGYSLTWQWSAAQLEGKN